MTMMDGLEAQRVISQYRGDAIVVSTMTTDPEWAQVSSNLDLDLPLTGSMGKASSIGLGLALARPDKKVIILDGDGSLLMNLGSLITIANMAPTNLIHFLFENGIYRVSGSQPIPNTGKISFTDLARGAGYTNVYEFEELEVLKNSVERVINQLGPTFVCLKLPPAREKTTFPTIRTTSIIQNFKAALQKSL